MQNPQPLPRRQRDLVTRDPEELSDAQPERRREYVQLERGEFRGELSERSDGEVAGLHERWTTPMRVRCARPPGYVALASILAARPARFCEVEVDADSVVDVERSWELTTRGPVEIFSLAIAASRLEAAEAQHLGEDPLLTPPSNRVLVAPAQRALAARLRHLVSAAVGCGDLHPVAWSVLEDEIVHLAVRIRSCGREQPGHPEPDSQRRRAIRRVEEYLAAHPGEVPPVGLLCQISGVSERTLEYAFRAQLGITPARYLRVRRLNGARSELRSSSPGDARVADVAMRHGFWELGRFAREYRELFGELPSQTLAGTGRVAAENPNPA